MIYEVRTYTCHVGTVQRQIAFYRDYGMDTQIRHLGVPVVFGASEFGDVNTYMHIWKFKDLDDREFRRAELSSDLNWQDFQTKSKEMNFLSAQTSQLLLAPEFMRDIGNSENL